MLIGLTNSFGTTVSVAATIATAHFLTYGLGQLIWGILSDRFGRLLVVRVALVGTILGCFFSALAPTISILLIMRAITGAFCGAIIPATITYIGDTVSIENRQESMADMLAIMAVGSALATGLAGVIAEWSWRVVFLLTACLALVAITRICGIKNVTSIRTKKSPLNTLTLVFRSPWVCSIIVFALVEGALVLGLFALLPAVMEQRGLGASAAGSVAALYGISVLIVTRLVKKLAKTPLLPMGIGGFCLISSYALPVYCSGVIALACTSALLGATWALFHSSLQSWTTMIVPLARGTTVAAMTSALFLGGGFGSMLAGPLVESHDATFLFKIAAIVSILLVLSAVIARRQYIKSHSTL